MSETPLPNSEAARSPTGEILEPSQIAPTPAELAAAERAKSETPPAAEPKTGETSSVTTTSSEPPKPEDDKKPSEPGKVPETYATFTVPEGHTLDAKLIEEATPIFKELGLTQDQAQKLVSLQAAREIAIAKGPAADYETLRTDWRNATLADADIKAYAADGKTGIDAVKVDLGRALATIDPKLATDFKTAMDLTGAGDNPAIVKGFWRLAQSVIEGKHVSGRGPSPLGQKAPGGGKPSAAQSMYPSLPSANGTG